VIALLNAFFVASLGVAVAPGAGFHLFNRSFRRLADARHQAVE
tara:strand:+ start:2017 stop:2145 length:129 start_codon:yes stop_codon:yes gene_type:complete